MRCPIEQVRQFFRGAGRGTLESRYSGDANFCALVKEAADLFRSIATDGNIIKIRQTSDVALLFTAPPDGADKVL